MSPRWTCARGRSSAEPAAGARAAGKRFLVAVANHTLLIAFDRVPRAVRLHALDRADDEQPGVSASALAAPVPLAQLHRRLHEGAAPAVDAEHRRLLGARDARRRPARACPVAYALSRLRWRGREPRVHRRDDRADDAAAGLGGPALRHVGEDPSSGNYIGTLCAADHAELVRRRVLDLPAAAVLPVDPGGVHRRGARRRLRRVPDPHDRRARARQAGDRRGRAVLDPLHVQRLLPAPALLGREPAQLGAVDRALASSAPSIRCSGT